MNSEEAAVRILELENLVEVLIQKLKDAESERVIKIRPEQVTPKLREALNELDI